MFPKKAVQSQCLESLIGIRTSCSYDDTAPPPFFLEDIEGMDITKLAGMAKATNLSGDDYGKQLIGSSAREMLGDIQLMLNNGYRLKELEAGMCSSCSLLPVYTANTGIIIKSVVASNYQILRITRLNVLTNVTGVKEIKIDDGITVKTISPDLVANVIMPINLNYSTTQKSVKIYFTDVTVGLGQVTCAKNTSCGCGSTTTSNPIVISGLVAGVESSIQYGFLPCATIDCSYDALVCGLIKSTPNLFGLALIYKIGEKYFFEKAASSRNNDSVAYNEEQGDPFVKQYGRLYWYKMNGTTNNRGIKHVMNDYLAMNKRDRCIICDNRIQSAYVTG